ncbi:hypothetical protein [Streptomyces sp. HUAS ZL42]|uniref:hypothetical protein n=1 Tax=Streptomyces sp. HUAS ZL42 TaxID=3231715 RepID=UPI00345E85F1
MSPKKAPRAIRAILVIPGLIDTPMGLSVSAQRASRTTSFERIPFGRQGTVWEVAAAVTVRRGTGQFVRLNRHRRVRHTEGEFVTRTDCPAAQVVGHHRGAAQATA